MKPNSRLALASAILPAVLSLLPSIALAQRAAHPVSSAARVAPHRVTSRPASTRAPKSSVTSNGFANGFGLGGGVFLSGQNPFDPGFGLGLGFASNLGLEAAIDPATQWRLATAERILKNSGRFAGSSFYLLDGGGAYALLSDSDQGGGDQQQLPQQQQQPIIVVQQAPNGQQGSAQSEPEDSAPLPDVGQFTLVLRNGTQIQAIAFTRTNNSIVYITPEGTRHTIAVADLNSGETLRINQERGTPLQLPL
jgi:hypothetical protein